MHDFDGRTALVTGGTSGIGRAVAEAFAAAGARVVVAARSRSRGLETVGAIERAGGDAWYLQTDVSSIDATEELVEKTLEFTTRLDFAVNAAAATDPVLARLTDVPEEDFDESVSVSLKGVWLCMRAQIPALIASGGGCIINLSAQHGLIGRPVAAHYAAAKEGVIGLSRAAALEYAGEGVRINVVCPGPTDTQTTGRVFAALAPNDPEQARKDFLRTIPLGRIATPGEIAEMILWLCSPSARNVTGSIITSDGGLSAAR